MPDEKKNRLADQYTISEYDASVITSEPDLADFFELAAKNVNGKITANLMINELFGRLNKDNLKITDSPINSSHVNKICSLINDEKISNKIAKDLFDILWTDGGDPEELVQRLGLSQLTDENELNSLLSRIIEENPEQVIKAKENPKLRSWFVGQAMKASQGKANPKTLNKILETLLS